MRMSRRKGRSMHNNPCVEAVLQELKRAGIADVTIAPNRRNVVVRWRSNGASVPNKDAKDKLWKCDGKRQVVYARDNLQRAPCRASVRMNTPRRRAWQQSLRSPPQTSLSRFVPP